MSFVGVNVGALTVKVVALQPPGIHARVVPHQGRPREVLRELLATEFADGEFFGISGSMGQISEVAAIQRALREVAGGSGLDAVAALGGESFLVYILAGDRVVNVLSHNKCAAGSGEFFVQQIGRMGLTIDEAIKRSFQGRVVPLASRCSVHCKSDITHKLNRHEASPEEILYTLHDSMASKVVALLERSQHALERVLVIGGVSRNEAMLSALRAKLPHTDFVVLPESPWFEAWGTALLVRDDPRDRSPRISVQPSLGTLPSLRSSAHQVHVIAEPPLQRPPDRPLVLGVDAGSTTTKTILLDPSTRAVVAAHYTRTRGDPAAATRQCLRALVEEVGNQRVCLVGTTGSARELIGAYLGTCHVYNEISSHAAGATHFDAEVETIFEIGGQDAKYIALRHGVPVDYAMNNACSAGTGSFLEESAQGDLGITVDEIAAIALEAPTPVHFQATCAAFINSEIRVAQQQGYARDSIVAGLVSAIAANYLNRVKGARSVGRKVFLQGGVALNRAVGHAFAQKLGREVVIPPRPELLGALGVAVLALERSGGAPAAGEAAADLLTLAAPELCRVGQFTCGACAMSCTIDRFDVAGRRFPFGGRCSLFENVWKRKSRIIAAPDLVAERAAVIFSHAGGPSPNGGLLIGIPRALTTHSLFPLYATFFRELDMEVVLSGVDPQGELKAYSGFCFPAQIAHGAVLDLARRGVSLIFLPHVTRMPQPNPCRDSYLCPITQAGPYFLAKAFPTVRLLSPLLDFTRGYEPCSALVELAARELGCERGKAERAWSAAVSAQVQAERALDELGQRALARALAEGKPAILLAGHSYNAFTPEASQSVNKKLASMGVLAIPADCLDSVRAGPTAWHFANQLLNAVALAKRHPQLYLLCVSNFSCTIDAFSHSMLASEMGTKPYLILEIDAHTADAGVQTRLEAFLDIIQNASEPAARPHQPFTPCRLVRGGRVQRSSGEQVPLQDPRVKLWFPNFSLFHAESLAMAVGWLGLSAGSVLPLDQSQLDRGLLYTSGRECLPLPLCIGQLLRIHENRGPGEIAGLFVPQGGAPCVVDAYQGYLERFLAEQQLPDLFLFYPGADNDFCGIDKYKLAGHISTAVLVADILVEIEQALRVVGAPGSGEQLRAEWQRFVATARSLDQFHQELPGFIARLAALPRTCDPMACPRVLVTGDFFTRFSSFFMRGVASLYADKGIILRPVDLSDLALYVASYGVNEAACGWGMRPGSLATAKACTRIFQPDGQEYLQSWLAYQAELWYKAYYRGLFRKSGLLSPDHKDNPSLFEKAAEHVSPTLFSEVTPTVDDGLEAESNGYDGIILIGPFNCLPFRISEAILKPLSLQRGMPLLAYESDGYAVAPSFLRQVDVHIQQVLAHAARISEAARTATANGGLAGFLWSAVGKLQGQSPPSEPGGSRKNQ